MQPVQITVRDMPFSKALESHIRKKVEKLSHFYQRIQSCHVVINVPQKHKRQGKLFSVRIDLMVPGKEIVVNKKLDEDVYIAIRDAFNALVRQLESYSHIRRGNVKVHDSTEYGHIVKLFNGENYGFILGADGNEYYFSPTHVHYPEFEKLKIGDRVQFIGIPSGDGFQAHRVIKEKNNHIE